MHVWTKKQNQPKRLPKNNVFPPCHATNLESFTIWDNNVRAILATPEWSDLYNPLKKDVILDGTKFPELNNHLFSSLSNCMRGNNIKIMQSKRELHQDGISFLRALCRVYKTRLSGYKLRTRYGAFGTSKINPDETIDDFAAHFLKEKRALEEESLFERVISPTELKEIFIYGLPPEFTKIKRKIRHLDPEWNPIDINQLIPVAKNYLQEMYMFRLDNKLYAEKKKQHSKDK